MNAVSTRRMRDKTQGNALNLEPEPPFVRISNVASKPKMWLSNVITAAGPLSQDMLSLGGSFIFGGPHEVHDFPAVPIAQMGFPANWQNSPLWK